MTDVPNKPLDPRIAFVQRLAKETNITEEQARKLIALIGYEWSSLVREATLLAKKK
ncbi:hypothetical protein J1C56_16760 [Aminobacter anthyllidis]|uniref:Uncharacterized protein n=1 Tax=Aminobacter anthyllidis TaxID=1035067 RepID=A0A9X1ACD3_9HYPH|nr:hypothetical protein [Aminobacter anthyllidis]MBT1157250.1 hypothetical protein [Aminobacter anthyllidis]